jgi:uncharacterized protein YaaN involved in tellurite resistance
MAGLTLDLVEIKENVEKNIIEEKEKKLQNPKLQALAKQNAVEIFSTDFDDPNKREAILKPLEEFGASTISRSASKNKLLSTRFVDFEKGGEEAAEVGDKLSELNLQMKDLDPSMLDFTKKGLLGNLFNPVRKYFNRYEKAEKAINNIVKSLEHGQKVLTNDNTTLLSEETYLRELTEKLIEGIELGKLMDEELEKQIEEAHDNGIDANKIKLVEEKVLYPLRQRIMDMDQMIVVNQQGIVSLNVVRQNNKVLINGVDRAKNVTITALQTGVMLAGALYSQKIVLKKIQTLNETTEDIIRSTSRMLKEQGAEIQRQSSETMINPDVLKASFTDALAALDDISNYRQQALPKMKQTIEAFNEMAIEGDKVVCEIEFNDTIKLE